MFYDHFYALSPLRGQTRKPESRGALTRNLNPGWTGRSNSCNKAKIQFIVLERSLILDDVKFIGLTRIIVQARFCFFFNIYQTRRIHTCPQGLVSHRLSEKTNIEGIRWVDDTLHTNFVDAAPIRFWPSAPSYFSSSARPGGSEPS